MAALRWGKRANAGAKGKKSPPGSWFQRDEKREITGHIEGFYGHNEIAG